MLPKSELDTTKIWHPEVCKGKVALITGGSNRGMLSEIAKAYLVHGAAAVGLVARKEDKLKEVCAELQAFSKTGKVVAIKGDVRDEKSCDVAVKSMVDQFGRVDILVNGAAGNFMASASKLTAKGMKTVLEIDTLGTFNMSRSVFNNAMKKQGGGVIINISATLHWNGTAMQIHSSAGKAGVDAITKVLAVEWGPHNVRVCGIVPGAISGTEGFERLGSMNNLNNKAATEKAFESKASSSQAKLLQFAPAPIMRFGEVEDIANCAIYLASPAGAYVTGYNVLVDGGMYLTAANPYFHQPAFVDMWAKAKL